MGLKGNHFELTIREIDNVDSVIHRLSQVKDCGVPNYFGDQRFGVRRNDDGTVSFGGTLALGLRMVEGEPIRNRNKRNLAISALRSVLFNHVISERIASGKFEQVFTGDACVLQGSNSFFIATEDSLAETNQRYQSKDLSPSAPLVGAEDNPTTGNVHVWEREALANYQAIVACLQAEEVKTRRRAIKIWPQDLEWQSAHDKLTVSFTLPAGCFATSVLRECVMLNETQESGNE